MTCRAPAGIVWGSGVQACGRALASVPAAHRDGILNPCTLGSAFHPLAGRMLGAAVLLQVLPSTTVMLLYLTWGTQEQGEGAPPIHVRYMWVSSL